MFHTRSVKDYNVNVQKARNEIDLWTSTKWPEIKSSEFREHADLYYILVMSLLLLYSIVVPWENRQNEID